MPLTIRAGIPVFSGPGWQAGAPVAGLPGVLAGAHVVNLTHSGRPSYGGPGLTNFSLAETANGAYPALRCPNVAGSYAERTGLPTATPTASIRVVVDITPDDWTPSAAARLFRQVNIGSIQLGTDGQITCYGSASSGSTTGLSLSGRQQIKMVRNILTDTVAVSTRPADDSTDNSTPAHQGGTGWTAATMASNSITDGEGTSATSALIGASVAGASPFGGIIHGVYVYADGVLLWSSVDGFGTITDAGSGERPYVLPARSFGLFPTGANTAHATVAGLRPAPSASTAVEVFFAFVPTDSTSFTRVVSTEAALNTSGWFVGEWAASDQYALSIRNDAGGSLGTATVSGVNLNEPAVGQVTLGPGTAAFRFRCWQDGVSALDSGPQTATGPITSLGDLTVCATPDGLAPSRSPIISTGAPLQVVSGTAALNDDDSAAIVRQMGVVPA